jgi:pilus assembly protein CpaC
VFTKGNGSRMGKKAWRRGLAALLVAVPALAASGAIVTVSENAQAQKSGIATEAMDLTLGEQRTLPSDNVRSYSEGVKGIVDIRLTKEADQFVIVALRPGATTLLLILMDGTQKLFNITVTDPNKSQTEVKVVQRNPNAVEAKDSIRLDFYFLQLDKTYNHQLGVTWPPSFLTGATANFAFDLQEGALTSATMSASQALPGLDLAQASGYAKLLRHATVITANGSRAEFSGGAEVNVKVAGGLTTGVQSISYGSKIAVDPRYDAESGRIELQINADVSDLTADGGTGAPGRTTSTVSSLVNLELGQSVMLGGLVSEAEQRSKGGLPGLSQIPVLGLLFGVHSKVASNTENVVFIVPSVVDATSFDVRARIKDALDVYSEYDGDLEEVDFIPLPAQSRASVPAKKQ